MPDPRHTIDFYTFVLSIGSSALVHLGDAPHPETGKPVERNLPLAQQSIEILAMLQEKTRGNLTRRGGQAARPAAARPEAQVRGGEQEK